MIKSRIVRFLCVIGIGVILILSCGLLFRQCGPNTTISVSPNNKFAVSYNSFSKTIRVSFKDRASKGGASEYFANAYNPVVMWSSDSRYMIIVYDEPNGKSKNITKEMFDYSGSSGFVTHIGYEYAFERATGYDPHKVQFRIIEFVDDSSVLIEFVIDQEHGQQIAGRYVFDFESGFVRDIQFVV